MDKFEINYKTQFVKNSLEPLLKEVNNRIIKAEYVLTDSNDEYVIVTFYGQYQKKICVTADSLKAMVIDCMYGI